MVAPATKGPRDQALDVRAIEAGRLWYVQTTHAATGLPYNEEHCPQFATLADANEWCDYQDADAEAWERSDVD